MRTGIDPRNPYPLVRHICLLSDLRFMARHWVAAAPMTVSGPTAHQSHHRKGAPMKSKIHVSQIRTSLRQFESLLWLAAFSMLMVISVNLH